MFLVALLMSLFCLFCTYGIAQKGSSWLLPGLLSAMLAFMAYALYKGFI